MTKKNLKYYFSQKFNPNLIFLMISGVMVILLIILFLEKENMFQEIFFFGFLILLLSFLIFFIFITIYLRPKIKEKYIALEELFPSEENYTILAGAGISANPPSNLPDAQSIVKNLIKISTPQSDSKTIIKLQDLRYEYFVELFKKNIDPNLRFLNYFEKIETPNIVHFFLAQMIEKGHNILTSNHDYLIEFAYKKAVRNDNLYPVITKDDFKHYYDPNILKKTGKYPLFKIHGSKKDIINNRNTEDFLVTTISALGRGRAGFGSFEIEDYKKKAIKSLTSGNIIIVMGYSGRDTFDIIPALMEFHKYPKLIWINHKSDLKLQEKDRLVKVFRIKTGGWTYTPKFLKDNYIDKVLSTIALKSGLLKKSRIKVYRIDVDTMDLISNLLWKIFLNDVHKPTFSSIEITPIKFEEWISSQYGKIRLSKKLQMAFDIYKIFSLQNYALECAKKKFKISEKTKSLKMKAHSLIDLAQAYELMGKKSYPKAINIYKKAYKIAENIGDLSLEITCLEGLSSLYIINKDFTKAHLLIDVILNKTADLSLYEEGPKIVCNMAKIMHKYKNIEKQVIFFKMAVSLANQKGDLLSKAEIFYEMGIAEKERDIDFAIEKLKDALDIAEELNNLRLQIKYLVKLSRLLNQRVRFYAAWSCQLRAIKLGRNFKKIDPLMYKQTRRLIIKVYFDIVSWIFLIIFPFLLIAIVLLIKL
ncbi:MAG: hypothetical protein ACFFAN_04045 [Promethearchaeota archaeon]